MKKTRLAAWPATRRRALTMAVAAVSLSAAFAASASADVYSPDGTTLTLEQAVTMSNTHPGADTILLINGTYYQPTASMSVTDPAGLTITDSHNGDASQTGDTDVDGSGVPLDTGALFNVAAGSSLRIEGFQILYPGDAQDPGVNVVGGASFEMDDVDMNSMFGQGINISSTATAVINNSSIDNGQLGGIVDAGALTINNSDIVYNGSGGIRKSLQAPNVVLNNTIVSRNNTISTTHANCTVDNGTGGYTSDAVISSDTSCAPTIPNNTAGVPAFQNPNGGPVSTYEIDNTSAAYGAGDVSKCALTDGRFFPRGGTRCDIGEYQVDATQDTTPPSCSQTSITAGPPKMQTVTVTDASGFESGPINTGFTYTNEAIDNGSIATPVTASTIGGSSASQAITATKADQAQLTHWSFDLTDWAGNTTHCV